MIIMKKGEEEDHKENVLLITLKRTTNYLCIKHNALYSKISQK